MKYNILVQWSNGLQERHEVVTDGLIIVGPLGTKLKTVMSLARQDGTPLEVRAAVRGTEIPRFTVTDAL